MGHPALIGATTPGGTYTARYLHWSDHPNRLIPNLRQIWTETFATDSTRMVEALLDRDWSNLSTQLPTASSRGSSYRASARSLRAAPAAAASPGMSRLRTAAAWNGCT